MILKILCQNIFLQSSLVETFFNCLWKRRRYTRRQLTKRRVKEGERKERRDTTVDSSVNSSVSRWESRARIRPHLKKIIGPCQKRGCTCRFTSVWRRFYGIWAVLAFFPLLFILSACTVNYARLNLDDSVIVGCTEFEHKCTYAPYKL